MTEKETNETSLWGRFSFKGDALLKWYYIFASFLFLNLCGVGYAYYNKFYKNKSNTENAANNIVNKVIVLPTDTIYVDHIDAIKPADTNDADESEDTKKSLPVSHIERYQENSFDVNASANSKINPSYYTSTDANITSSPKTKSSIPNNTAKAEEGGSHTYLIALGTFKVKGNALSLVAELKQKGVEPEIISSNHFAKMPPTYILVLGGKELSSTSASQMCNDLKKEGVECYVQDGGRYYSR
jgi:hypothetical protein